MRSTGPRLRGGESPFKRCRRKLCDTAMLALPAGTDGTDRDGSCPNADSDGCHCRCLCDYANGSDRPATTLMIARTLTLLTIILLILAVFGRIGGINALAGYGAHSQRVAAQKSITGQTQPYSLHLTPPSYTFLRRRQGETPADSLRAFASADV